MDEFERTDSEFLIRVRAGLVWEKNGIGIGTGTWDIYYEGNALRRYDHLFSLSNF